MYVSSINFFFSKNKLFLFKSSNYVNEKLQQIFIQFTLKNEQEEYVREGIKWTPIDYFNNKIVCDLIEERNPVGIFAVLDDVARSVHALDKGADEALAQRLTACNKNPHFQQRGVHFLVKHYAGDVNFFSFFSKNQKKKPKNSK